MSALIPLPSFLLVGPTGSGKSPLGDEIERRGLLGRRCVHFDFGANLRSLAADPRASRWLTRAEIEAIRSSLAAGALFEDSAVPMIVRILSRFAETHGSGPGALMILNGLPRHRRQAEGLSAVVSVERVVSLEADAAVIRERIRSDAGGDRGGRVDDGLEAVEKRLAVFEARTAPLVSYYRERGVPVVGIRVTAAMTAAEMYEALVRTVRNEEGGSP